jgi:uncharacterized protein (DUF885 family)
MTAVRALASLALTCLVLSSALLVGCSKAPETSADEQFVGLAGRYLDRMLEQNPEWATNLGDHRFDHMVSDLSAEGFAAALALAQTTLDSLGLIDPAELGEVNRIDYEILKEACEYDVFRITELKEHTWNPTWYNPGDGIYNILARDYAPIAERLPAAISRIRQIPRTIAAAKANLVNPPQVMTRTAIERNPGVIKLIMDGMNEHLDQVPQLKEGYAMVRAEAIAALTEYGRWLEEDLLPRSDGDFRIGCELYRQKLRFALSSDLSPEEILASAGHDLGETRARMYQVAVPLYTHYGLGDVEAAPSQDHVIRAVLDRLAEDRPTNATIMDEARRGLAATTAFVRERNLVTVPDDPVEIIVMPEHQRGFSVAYCDAPGPLEKGGETFYAISPTPSDWSAARAETFYREYNDWMLLDLTIHEAMPGHYLQLAHANKFEAPTPLRAIYSSGTFVEGWATYAEQLMVEAGYAGPELQMQQLKMKLRLIINAIIDQKIHCEGMTRDEAVAMMMVEGFQEEAEAVGKWKRAQLSSTQLATYYVGNLEINAIREAAEAKAGADFDLKAFHDELLSFGSPAPKHARQLMGL